MSWKKALYDGYEADNLKNVLWFLARLLEKFWTSFLEKLEAVATSGYILESSEVKIYKD